MSSFVLRYKVKASELKEEKGVGGVVGRWVKSPRDGETKASHKALRALRLCRESKEAGQPEPTLLWRGFRSLTRFCADVNCPALCQESGEGRGYLGCMALP